MSEKLLVPDIGEFENVEVTFVGNWNHEIDHKKVIMHKPMNQVNLSRFYRENHILLFPSKNESCPNTVLEALSSGLPILYHESGGTPEIAKNYGVPINTEDYVESLEKIKNNYGKLNILLKNEIV